MPLDPDDLDARRALVESESVRIVRRRGDLIISETRHGFVCANAGIDLSNVERRLGRAAAGRLRPLGASTSATRCRARPASRSAVIVSDTFGRPWRHGLTDVAIGVSGIAAVVDLRDTADALGRELQVTEVAVADEIASAAELVMGKATSVPVAIVRGLDPTWFRRRLGARAHPPAAGGPLPVTPPCPAFVEARRSIRAFLPEPVAARRPRRARRGRVPRARTAPLAAVAVRGRRHRRGQAARSRTAWASGGATDLAADGVAAGTRRRAGRRVARASSRGAPALVLGCLTWDGLDRYPDERRQRAEWGMALLSLGAAVENLMLTADRPRARVVLGRGADLLPRGGARRARARRPSGSRTRSCSSATPIPRYVGRTRPPVPLDELRRFA